MFEKYRYNCINGTKSWSKGAKNNFPKVVTSKAVEGGTIIFSLDNNDEDKIKSWIQHKNMLNSWRIGNYFKGNYITKNGQNYGENSLSLEIVDVDFNTLVKIAEEICIDFKQESVLLHDFSTGRILFVDPSKI